jgi:hypothetical protein
MTTSENPGPDCIDMNEHESDPDSDTDPINNAAPEPVDGQEHTPERELVPMLLGSFEASNASWETKVLVNFLSQQDDEAVVAEDDKAWAWIDDREISAGRSRDYQQSFNAKDLREILERPVRYVSSLVVKNLTERSASDTRLFEMSISG